MAVETVNAIIESANFDTERGLSAWVTLDYGWSCQGFGGWMLYVPESWGRDLDGRDWSERNRANFCGHFVYRVLEIACVDDWAKLKGRTVRAKREHSKVHAIGHIVKDDWFDPTADFKRLIGDGR